jgi:hypothetical protein
MGTQIFYFKIILQDKGNPVVEDTTIGLYNVTNDNSEFRWIQNAIAGVSTWKAGMIIEHGLKPFSVEIDLKRGGACSYPGSGSIAIKNSSNFWSTINVLKINLNGLKCEVGIFNGTTPLKLRTYKCEEPSWDSREYNIPFKGAQEDRVANILNVVTSVQFPTAGKDSIGKIIPASFGKIFQIGSIPNNLAEFIRITNDSDDTIFTNYYFTGTRSDLKIFPCYSVVNNTQFNILVSGIMPATTLVPADCYCVINSGTGEKQIRQVLSFIGTGTDGYVTVTTSKSVWFYTTDTPPLEVPSHLNDDTRSWVQFLKISRDFFMDHFNCGGFLKSDTGSIIDTPEIYTNIDDKMERIADFGFSVKSAISKNSLQINGEQFSEDIDKLQSFIILPCSNMQLVTDATLNNYTTSLENYNIPKYIDGIYITNGPSFDTFITINSALSNPDRAYDKDSTTYADFTTAFTHISPSTGHPLQYTKAVKFGLPKIPQGLDVKSINIGIKMTHIFSGAAYPQMCLAMKRFVYNKTNDHILGTKAFATTFVLENLPDFYYESNKPASSNLKFYRSLISAGINSEINGYTNFILTGITAKEYATYDDIALLITNTLDDTGVQNDVTGVYELAIIFELNESTLQEKIYVPASGRIFSDTFAGRKTAANLITKPEEIFEHVSRLQDYRDTCITPPSGWGLQYAGTPLIATVGFGGFDNTSLNFEPAGQIFDLDAGYTDQVKQSICREFELANWQDANGYERILALPTQALAPIYTITLSDIMDRNKIKIIEPSQSDIFPEPFVKYNKNPATGEYQNQITIKNSSATYYLSSYVDGVQNAGEAQALWQGCHSLALKNHQTGKPPSDLTDLQWANGVGGYSIALSHLQKWVAWQSCTEIELPLHFNTAGSWQECSPVNLVFSHQTNNIVRSALVENSTVNPNPPYDVMIKAIIYA